jgi:hypothetical protein
MGIARGLEDEQVQRTRLPWTRVQHREHPVTPVRDAVLHGHGQSSALPLDPRLVEGRLQHPDQDGLRAEPQGPSLFEDRRAGMLVPGSFTLRDAAEERAHHRFNSEDAMLVARPASDLRDPWSRSREALGASTGPQGTGRVGVPGCPGQPWMAGPYTKSFTACESRWGGPPVRDDPESDHRIRQPGRCGGSAPRACSAGVRGRYGKQGTGRRRPQARGGELRGSAPTATPNTDDEGAATSLRPRRGKMIPWEPSFAVGRSISEPRSMTPGRSRRHHGGCAAQFIPHEEFR